MGDIPAEEVEEFGKRTGRHWWATPAWEVFSRPVEGGGHKTYCRAQCASCGAHQEISWHYNGRVPADEMKRRWQREGWAFDANVPKRCRCPECNKKGSKMKTVQTAKNGVDTHPPPLPPPMEVEVKETPLAKAREIAAKQEEEKPTPASLAATLTPPQRKKIRDLLDAAYDDKTSMYLAGHSDQRIGKMLDIPWAAVAYLREQAYGPLKEDPKMVEIREELEELHSLYANFHQRLQSVEAKVAAYRGSSVP